MTSNVMLLSNFIIRNPDIMNFSELLVAIGNLGKSGAIMLQIDIKPDYRDTPKNWESQVESVFTWGSV
mgnify:CR=1 FL=1